MKEFKINKIPSNVNKGTFFIEIISDRFVSDSMYSTNMPNNNLFVLYYTFMNIDRKITIGINSTFIESERIFLNPLD